MWDRIARNALSNIAGTVVSLGVGFVTMPLVVNHLGPTAFGLWTLATGLAAYLGLFDLGLAPTLVKQSAELLARRDDEARAGLSETASTIYALYAVAGLLGFVALAAVAIAADRVFRIAPDELATFRTVLLLIGLQTAVGMPMSTWNGLLCGLEAFPLLNGLGIATSLLRGGLTIGLVQAGYGLVALVVSSGVVSVLGWAAARWLVHRRLPGVHIALGRARRSRLGQIGHFSIAMVVWSVAGAALHQLDRVLIGIFLPMRALTTYEVGARLTTYSRNVLHSWLSIVMPAASGLAARGDRSRLRGLFLRGTRYLIASYAGVALLLIGFGRPFIALWMGPGFDESASVLTLLVVGSLVQSQTVVAHVMLPAIGRLRTFTRFMAVYPVVTAIAAVAGITSAGLLGLAAGLSGAIAVMEGVCVVIALRCFEVTPARFFGRCHLPVVRSLLPAVALTALVRIEVPITSWGFLVAAVAGVGSLYLVAFWVAGMTRGERRQIARRVRAVAGVRPSRPALSGEAPC